MSDTDRGNFDLHGSKIIGSIVKALAEQPLYLLIFSIIFLTLLLCIYAFTLGADEPYLRLAALSGLILESVIAFVLIRSLEVGKTKQQITELRVKLKEQDNRAESLSRDLEHHDKHEINIGNEVMRKHYLSSISNTRKALAYSNATFVEEMEAAIANFDSKTGDWSNGHFITDALNYERIVWKFYKHATDSVFATSNEYYMKFWSNVDRSKSILDAHKVAYEMHKATVTRVFVFPTFTNILPEYIDIIDRQDDLPFISARVLIVDEHDNLKMAAPQLMKDFVIIDKGLQTQAIGIESSADLSAVGAKWIFSRSPEIEQRAQSMEQMSISIKDLRNRPQA